MESPEHLSALDAAITWHLRLGSGAVEDWTAFMLWLEASPHHREAYDRVSRADAGLDDVIRIMPANDVEKPRRPQLRNSAVAVLSIALVALAVLKLAPTTTTQRSSTYAIETVGGQHRSLVLADGSRVELNGDTRLLLDRGNARYAQLERGEAMFTVRHDARRPFTVQSGQAVLQDVGTMFNVARDDDRLDVAVVEGAVLYNPRKAAVMLRAGSTLAARDGEPGVKLGQADPEAMAGWRTGRLSYHAAHFPGIAADLTRATGVHITVSPGLAGRMFTGVIGVDQDVSKLIPRLEALLDVEARQLPGGWELYARSHAAN